MQKLFLQVNKDLFKLGLNPTELLIVSQILEFQLKDRTCFITDETLSNNFGVSVKTISRELKILEEKNLIKRNTKNVQGGKTRELIVNLVEVESLLKRFQNGQNDLCGKDNLSINNGQNDLIKDKVKDNIIKDNNGIDKSVGTDLSILTDIDIIKSCCDKDGNFLW